MPLVSEDLKAQKGIPEGAMRLGRMIADHMTACSLQAPNTTLPFRHC